MNAISWVAALILAAKPLLQEEKPRPGPPEKEIKQAIAELGHEEWKVREAATERLRKVGTAAVRYYREAYKSTQDPEVKVRIRMLAKDVFQRHIYKNLGPPFLGIRFLPLSDPPEGVEEGKGAFEVDMVDEGQPAQKAGIQPKDLIVAFNGSLVEKGETTGRFRHRILSCRVGQEVAVELIRAGERKTLKVRLGKTPQRQLEGVPPRFLDPYRKEMEFLMWWEEQFEPPPEPARKQRES